MEGQNFTLEWTYTLDGTICFAQIAIITSSDSELIIGRKFGPGITTLQAEYQARFRARATNTRTDLTIFAVQRSDEATYRVAVSPTGAGALQQLVVVTVKCKY